VPKLSKETKQIINASLKTPLPEIITGETGLVASEGCTIWYERIKPKDSLKGSVLLIMGNSADALFWPPAFISNFTQAGYEVIRYDHRGTGLSPYTKKWKKKNSYTLKDMTHDAITVLDSLKIVKAHIVGVSMGGIIAQIIALDYPDKASSLTCMMSSADIADSELPPMSKKILPKMISAVFKHGFFGSKKGQIKRQIVQKKILMGEATGDIDMKSIAEIAAYNLRKRDGFKLLSARHHYWAMLHSESRIEALKNLKLPTLIIHGKKDPVIPIAHGKKIAAIVMNADSLYIENMGHDLPDSALNKMTGKIITHFSKVQN
jgi:proline iminopeptidase